MALTLLGLAVLVATGQLGGKVLLGRFRSHRVLGGGLAVLCAAGAVLVLLVTTTDAGLPWIAAVLFLIACPVGMILPTTTALGLQRAPARGGQRLRAAVPHGVLRAGADGSR